MSNVHCSPEDSIRIHKDIKSKRSIGMHYGTIRAGISGHYETVTDAPEHWKKAAEAEGLEWDTEISLCDVGEILIV
jgi:N-acyl-phosphatidylethanolamine-hydrolysing phospholipase D